MASTPSATEFSHRRTRGRFIERHDNVAWRHDPLLDADAASAWHERMRLPRQIELQAESLWPLVTGNVKDIAKTFAVVMRPVLAPLCSSAMLVATVVPCMK